MPDGLEQVEGLLGVAERDAMVALVLGHQAEILLDDGLANLVAELLV